jgi:hypothetical protein
MVAQRAGEKPKKVLPYTKIGRRKLNTTSKPLPKQLSINF